MSSSIIENTASYNISDEIDFILNHFKGAKWPRTISTYGTKGAQIYCDDKELAMFFYDVAKFIDCRINAYLANNELFPIDFLMIDIDSSRFRSKESLDNAKSHVERKIKTTFGKEYFKAYSIIWSGNGYYFYIPLEAEGIIFEQLDYLSEFRNNLNIQLSRSFLRFAEHYLSCGYCDIEHNKDTSFKNCMLRIPGTYNSKCLFSYRNKGIKNTDSQIKVIKRWDQRSRVPIKLLLGDFYAWLIDESNRLKNRSFKDQKSLGLNKNLNNSNNASYTIYWIEKLLKTAIDDGRKRILLYILPRYLINTKMLSYGEARDILTKWLVKCDEIEGLDPKTDYILDNCLDYAYRNKIKPMGLERIKNDHIDLYNILIQKGVLDNNT